jgi:predicted amidohydrolase
MHINDKTIIIFPEYHLSDFPPQTCFTRTQAETVLRIAYAGKADIIISGYVEERQDKLFSSCLIIDKERIFNIQKKYPYEEENQYINPGDPNYQVIPLSIGASYFFICNDVVKELNHDDFRSFLASQSIKWFFLISAMGKNFDKNVELLIKTAEHAKVQNVVYCDKFNGQGSYSI